MEPPVRPASQNRINDQIRAPKVRLVDDDGSQVGIKSTAEALEHAYSKGLDLVEIAAQSDPPVAKVMDYGKYRYELEQKAKQARKHQSQIHVKEIKLRPKIQVHDYNTKKGHVVRFLNQRAKVKVTIMFRGRETTHPERGRDLLLRLAEDVKEIGVVEQPPLLDGRNMVMVLGPTKNAGVKKDAETENTQRSEEAVQADGGGQDPAPARAEGSQSREEVVEAEAMPRVKRSVHARKKRRKVLAEAKGYWGLKSKTYTHAKEQVEHSLTYAYRDRKNKKRTMRSLWIIRINAAARQHGLSYNQFVAGCRKAEIELDRKVLADIAVSDPAAFGAIAEQAKAALSS